MEICTGKKCILKGERMKQILCYGDSNTYGYIPIDGGRYEKEDRWTGRLQILLGDSYQIIEEGCNGRTTMFDDPTEPWRNGLSYLKPCLNSHKPLDMILLMLGTNDLKTFFHLSAPDIANGARTLVREIRDFHEQKGLKQPQILLMAPALIGDNMKDSWFACEFDDTSIERSKEFATLYQEVAKEEGCIFFNAAEHVVASGEDALHFTKKEHARLAQAVYETVIKYL